MSWICFALARWLACLNTLARRWRAGLGWRRTAPPRRRAGHRIAPAAAPVRARAKPAWVRTELIGLAARDPQISCRQLASVFNRRHVGDGMRVGKTFVDDLLRKHAADIKLQRQRLKRKHLPARTSQRRLGHGRYRQDR
jgi:hypothetical protein